MGFTSKHTGFQVTQKNYQQGGQDYRQRDYSEEELFNFKDMVVLLLASLPPLSTNNVAKIQIGKQNN